jgi:ATP/maltotriose-dependent transcriptional regulator MalT/DNA-binding SARP family transcriptional activator
MTPTEIPISQTKIVVPGLRPDILHRRRLLELFENLLEDKLFLVTAPAGYGKTSLLVDFARHSEMKVCWLSLDKLDKDPQRFMAYLIAALARKFPRFGKQSSAGLRSLLNLKQDKERLLTTIINEVYEQIDEHFVLVVDDYQFVDTVPFIREVFSRFIYLVGENCHVILSSRRLPALPDITLMVARQQVGGFDLELLAFRPEEIRNLFENNYNVTLTDQAVEDLIRRTEGWITGLHLSAAATTVAAPFPSTNALRADLTQASRLAGVELNDYLDQQVLAQQPPELRRFLLETSLLEEFDAGLCRDVLGRGDWERLLKTVRQHNLFVLAVGPGGKWIRYHHLFQEFLQTRIHQEDPGKTQTILVRLAEICEQRGEWEKAYAICRQFNDADLIANLIERAGVSMLLSEHYITFQAWLEDLPAALIEKRPALLSLKGALSCVLGEGYVALTPLEKAIREFKMQGDIAGLTLALIRRAAVWRLVGDYPRSLQDADEALHISVDRPDLQASYAEAERIKGVSLHHLGRLNEAVRIQESALSHYQQLADEKLSVAKVQMDLGMTYRANGDYPAARNAYEQAHAIWREQKNIFSQINVLNSLGVLYHYLGEYEQAVRAFETGVECARQSGSSWMEALILASMGDMYVEIDEYESARQAYVRATIISQQVNFQFLNNYLDLAQAGLARQKGDLKAAYAYLKNAEPSIQAGRSNHECGLFHLERGCLELISGDHAVSSVDLKQALDYFQSGGLAAETAWSQVWLAAVSMSSGDMVMARWYIHAAFNSGKPGALTSSLVQVLRKARPWISELGKDDEVGPILTPWLERVARTEKRLPNLRKHLRRLLVTVPIQAPHLSIQAFGKGRVRVNGRMITSAQWKTASVRELFFFILAASRPLTKEEIADILWPDIDANQVKLRFKNDLYRLRHALGQDIIQFENNLYHFNRLMDYEYDVDSFAFYLEKAQLAVEMKEKIAHLQKATSFRNGPYLQDIDSTWVWPERERLDRTCMEAFKQLIEIQRRNGDKKASLQTCLEALQIDTCREDIHRLAMQLQFEMGDRLAVIWQYKACRDALKSILDVSPSVETETLYRKLNA